MTLPASRNTTYAAGVRPSSADLNAIQDAIVNAHARINLVPAMGSNNDGGTDPTIYGEGDVGSDSVGNVFWSVPIRLPVGAVIQSITVRILEPDAVGEEIKLWIYEFDAASSQQRGDPITSGTSGAVATVLWDDATNDSGGEFPYTVPADSELHLSVQFPNTTIDGESRIFNIAVVYT